MNPPCVLLIFIDGIGLGPPGSQNPFCRAHDGFRVWADGQDWTREAAHLTTRESLFTSLDACIGVPGLPQSGTGQATLFTGVNCAQLAGRHFGPWPHSATRDVLRSHNVFRRVKDATGRDVAFANAFPDAFFERAERMDRWSTTTRCCLDSGTRLRTLDDLASGNALPADLTGVGLNRFVGSPTLLSEEESAYRLLLLAQRHAFTLFEYFLTDKAGHAQSRARADDVLESLSRFLHGLHRNRPAELTIVITSDHGNLEDLSVRTHTLNTVPLAAAGPGAPAFHRATDLTEVLDGIIETLGGTTS